jgi:hypothetical protein
MPVVGSTATANRQPATGNGIEADSDSDSGQWWQMKLKVGGLCLCFGISVFFCFVVLFFLGLFFWFSCVIKKTMLI